MTEEKAKDEASRALASRKQEMLRLLRRHVADGRVLEAMSEVRRELFLAADLRHRAYDDTALPIGHGQTMSQPLMIALMLQAAELRAEDRVLEVGTGSGYQAAVLSRMVREVVSVERLPALLEGARLVLREEGYTGVRVERAEGVLGLPSGGPYDAIVVAAGSPHVPRVLIEQLASDGRLVIPVGNERGQELVRARRTEHGLELVRLGACAFVPLIGTGAWDPPRE